MRRLTWSEVDAAGRIEALRRPAQQAGEETSRAVAALIADVRANGDAALRAMTERFDGVVLERFHVSEDEIAAAAEIVVDPQILERAVLRAEDEHVARARADIGADAAAAQRMILHGEGHRAVGHRAEFRQRADAARATLQ